MHVSLTYRNLDELITEDAPTVSIEQALIRLQNLGVVVDPDQAAILQDLQRRRNWIERHAYDRDPDDGADVSQAVGFIAYFLREFLDTALEDDIDADLLARVSGLSHDTSREGGRGTERSAHAMRSATDRQYLRSAANRRLDEWIQEAYPHDDTLPWRTPGSSYETEICPVCLEKLLVTGGHPESPYCFLCQTQIDVAYCEHCGATCSRAHGPHCICDLRTRT